MKRQNNKKKTTIKRKIRRIINKDKNQIKDTNTANKRRKTETKQD